MLGVLILLGGIGGLFGFGVWVYHRELRSNPEIRLVNGQLLQAYNAVTIDSIEAWTTHKSTGGSYSSGSNRVTATAVFCIPVMRDGVRGVRPDGGPSYELVRFGWQEMKADELETVRLALAPHVSAPFVALERLTD